MADTRDATSLDRIPKLHGGPGEPPCRPPFTIDETLECIQQHLSRFYAAQDSRAVFLRAYDIMTREVKDALRGEGDFDPKPIFFDAEWVDTLAARFALLYFDSLENPACKAWKLAHDAAAQRRASVIENLLLGINAHINYDLAICLHALIVERGDHLNPDRMARRKFDHDQINNVLMRSLPKISETLAREFGGCLRIFSDLLGKVDELLTTTGLRYYRDRVWCNTLALLAAKDASEREKVERRLNWESLQVAEFISDGSLLHRTAWRMDRVLRRWPSQEALQAPVVAEAAMGELRLRRAQHHRLQRPF